MEAEKKICRKGIFSGICGRAMMVASGKEIIRLKMG